RREGPPAVGADRRAAGSVREEQPCLPKPPSSLNVSRAAPRPCAATTSPMAAAKAAIGSSAMSPTHRDAASMSACTAPSYGKGAAGKWTDAATAQHGDLLDLIALSCGLDRLADVLAEARRFLGLTQPAPMALRAEPADGLPDTARRLLVMSYPLAGTVAETYLRNRGIA